MPPILALQQLQKRFGGVVAVDGVDLAVQPGEIHALIGPNGSGKSTTINLITGVYTPTAGQVVFQGRPIGGLPPHRVSRLGLARTFQNIRLFKQLSVLENVMVTAEVRSRDVLLANLWRGPATRRAEAEARTEAERTLSIVGLGQMAGAQADSLPYGKQRLVEIARALAARPSLLLLDEPAAGMNPEETLELMEKIVQIRASGISIMLVEHKMDLVMRVSDRITVLDFGHVIAAGTPDAVRHDERVIAAYLGRGLAKREATQA